MQQPAPYPTTPQQTFPGQYANPYHNSDGSSQASSGDHQYAPPQYQSVGIQGGQYAGLFAAAPDQVTSLQAELAKKKQRIAELQHEVDTTESHRRQVQAHNFELQEQVDQMQQMFQVSLLVLSCPALSCPVLLCPVLSFSIEICPLLLWQAQARGFELQEQVDDMQQRSSSACLSCLGPSNHAAILYYKSRDRAGHAQRHLQCLLQEFLQSRTQEVLVVERNFICIKQKCKDTYWSLHSVAQQRLWQVLIVLPLLQGHPAGFKAGLDPAQLQQLASENSTLQAQVAQLTQQLYQGEFY